MPASGTYLIPRLRRAGANVPLLIGALKLIWSASHAWTAAWLALLALQGLLPIASNLIVLDEPTSAMDPWAEREWMAHFRKVFEGRTVIVITHRLTTAMHADWIQVIHKGAVMESGTHAALVAQGGRYFEAWSGSRDAT